MHAIAIARMLPEVTTASVAAAMVTISLPFYLYGAWIMIDAAVVTWAVLVRHLRVIIPGLILTTIPVVFWMIPRLLDQQGGIYVVHAFLGLNAYALLVFGLTGIARIFQAKRAAALYDTPHQGIDLDEIHPDMAAWRRRLRIGVFGYVILWLAAWCLGVYIYLSKYWL